MIKLVLAKQKSVSIKKNKKIDTRSSESKPKQLGEEQASKNEDNKTDGYEEEE